MYADKVSSGTKRSVKDRLNTGDDDDFPSTRQTKPSKRQRQSDDKWKHDLYDDDDESPQVSNPKVGVTDLRLKLQKKEHGQVNHGGKGSTARGTQDLREKISGSMHAQPVNGDRPQTKKVVEVSKLARKNAVEVPTPETRKPTNPPTKKSQQKTEPSVDNLLQSLGLEKYSITFQAEEVDMTALTHMNDDDLKALGIPMGPRKKILLALDSRA